MNRMFMKLIVLMLAWIGIITVGAGCGAGTPSLTIDAGADRAAFRKIIPYPKNTIETSNLETKAREAFSMAQDKSLPEKGWWYINAHLLDRNDRRYTAMFALFHGGQIFGSIDELDAGRHHGLYRQMALEFNPETLTLRAGDYCRLQQIKPGALVYRVTGAVDSASLDLTLTAADPPSPADGKGEISMGLSGQSKYFYLTRLGVVGQGSIDNRPVELRGTAWMDHQWGNWERDDVDGWYWHSIHLANHVDIMIFEFFKDEKVIRSFCDLVMPDGRQVTGQPFRSQALKTWTSPRTGRVWNIAWSLSFPKQSAQLTVIPDGEDREIGKFLWEGGAFVTGKFDGAAVTGRSFFEMHRK